MLMTSFVIVALCFSSNTTRAAINTQTAAASNSASQVERDIALQRGRLNSASEDERLDAIIKLGAYKRPDTARVAALGLRDNSARVRAAAINVIDALPPIEKAASLLLALNDKDEFVRTQAAYAAGNSNGVESLSQRLIQLLEKDKSAAVRGASAVALGERRERAAVSNLLSVLNRRQRAPGFFNRVLRRWEDENEFVRRAAVVALGQIGDRQAAPALINLLNDEETEDDIRREAARALGAIGDVSASPALRSALRARDPYLSNIARDALRKIERGG